MEVMFEGGLAARIGLDRFCVHIDGARFRTRAVLDQNRGKPD
jgi:hypothetical protein